MTGLGYGLAIGSTCEKMTPSSSKPSTLDGILDWLDKSTRILGFAAALSAAVTFSIGNKTFAYISVVVAYISFSIFLLSRTFLKEKEPSMLNEKGVLIFRKKPVYPLLSRIVYAAVTVLLTLVVAIWLGVNLWNDYQQYRLNLSASREPITISSTNSTNGLSGGGQSSASAINFSQEQLSIYSCIYGISKNHNGESWEITAYPPGNINTTAGPLAVDSAPSGIEKALLLTPSPIIVSKISIVIDEYSPPIDISDLDFHVSPGCILGGGGPVETIQFQPANIIRSQNIYELEFPKDSGKATLPYQLGAYDALVLSVPLKPVNSGIYKYHFSATIVDYSGAIKDINSQSLQYNLLEIDLSTLSKQVIHAP